DAERGRYRRIAARRAARNAPESIEPGAFASGSILGQRLSGLFEVVLELAAPGRVTQLAQRLRLDLADPLAGHVELLADLLEGPGTPVLQAEPELQHAA